MQINGITFGANTGRLATALDPGYGAGAAASSSSASSSSSSSYSAPASNGKSASNGAPASNGKSAAAPKPAPTPAAVYRGGSASSSGDIAEELTTAVYSTTVGGKSYSGNVQQEPGGTYEAAIPNLPGAVASGSSIEAAETNLGNIVDILA